MKKLDDTKIAIGRLIKVLNEDKKRLESKIYYALKVEDEDGSNEKWLLLTSREIQRLPLLSMNSLFHGMKLGRLYKFIKNDKKAFLAKIICEKDEMVVILSMSLLARCYARALKNKEDIPKQKILANLLD